MQAQTVFAAQTKEATEVADKLAELLDLSFVPHESSYRGEYWRHTGESGITVLVAHNMDPMHRAEDPEEEQFVEPAFRSFGVLIYITVPLEWEERFSQAVASVAPVVVQVRRNAVA
jgi:hypothetical protein